MSKVRASFPSKPKILYLEFWDHCIKFREPMLSRAVGMLLDESDSHYLLTAWDTHQEGMTEEDRSHNHEPIVVLKCAIIRKKIVEI